jgi:hypothetical protein
VAVAVPVSLTELLAMVGADDDERFSVGESVEQYPELLVGPFEGSDL